MFVAFKLKNRYLDSIDLHNFRSCTLGQSIWIDLINPTDNEYEYIYIELGANLIKFLKASNIHRNLYFLKSEDTLYIQLSFLYEDANSYISNIIISFVICDGRLYTFSDRNISIFFYYQVYFRQYPVICGNVYGLLLNLFEIFLDYLSDKIKFFYKSLEDMNLVVSVGLRIYEYDKMLSTLSLFENINWKICLSLLDIQRVMDFLICKVRLSCSDYKDAKDISLYVKFLICHNESLLKKVHFLIQLIMNFITIEQNRVIKILSVIFLPPTLVASSYGMNFEFMPELRWSFGYPAAIILMILSGLIPYFYFRYKKWL